MTNPLHDRSDAEQLRARQVGQALPTWPQEPPIAEDAELDELVERVRWLMLREPMLEGRELRMGN